MQNSDISSRNGMIFLFLGSADTNFSIGDRLSLNGTVYNVTSREKYIFRNKGLYTRAVLNLYQPPQEDDYDNYSE
ncbi:MAG: hypothetical protein IJV39_05820 [Ruminococcus sp.]|nr:hypothetical protein [Ruminococcus sp.]